MRGIEALLTTDAIRRPGDRVKALKRDRLATFFANSEFTPLIPVERRVDERESLLIGSMAGQDYELLVEDLDLIFDVVIGSEQHFEIAPPLGFHLSAFRK
jgi:hypothetical protein